MARSAWLPALLLAPTFLLAGGGEAQFPPDLGPYTEPLDEVLGQVVPPALNATYSALGQNITREDVRLFLDLNVTRGDAGGLGLLLGSGNVEVQASIFLRGEFRVISSERVYQAAIGENPYNVSAENATFLTNVFLPAEAFRATVTAEAIALFQAEQEAAIADMLENSLPELEVLNVDVAWMNVLPTDALTDFSLTEPPIIVEVDAKVRYLRVESLGSLLGAYLGTIGDEPDPKTSYVQALKRDHGDPLRTRDFFAAAAYTQLLNLSMQPGWSLHVDLHVPRGYSFEYFNENVTVSEDLRSASFEVDASSADSDQQTVVLASLTHRKAVALALFIGMWVAAGLLVLPFRSFYAKRRVPRMLRPPEADAPGPGKRRPKRSSQRPRSVAR